MKITIEYYGYTYMAEGPDDVTVDKLFGRLLIPLVISCGYSVKNIAELFKEGNPVDWDSAYE